jgi:3-hydroxybutyryl-CoA dehydrogenase
MASPSPSSAWMADPAITVGVVGAGAMGSGIAQVFAQAGLAVRLHDASPAALSRAERAIADSIGRFVEKGTISAAAGEAALAAIQIASLEDTAASDVLVEAIVEDLEAKQGLLARLDALADRAEVLASNTSSISITTLAAATSRPGRVIGMHFMNPVPIMPLVELVRGQSSSEAAMATAHALCARIGKTAIEAADYPGFIANRILMPMLNEAMFALMEGVGTAEAIDAVMHLGLKHPMGPLTLADFIGLDVCLSILDVLHAGFGDPKYRACPLLRRMVAAGQLGRKSGQGFYRYT